MGRRIVIVGNGEISEGLAATIDSADLVMRFNDCRSVGPGGERTDIVAVCNTGRPGKAMTEGSSWVSNRSVRLASSIWCVRDPQKFKAMEPSILRDHPELDDFCDDYTGAFADYTRHSGKDFHIVPGTMHEALDTELAPHAPAPYVVPSTGAVAIAEFIAHYRRPSDEVLLAGFGHHGWDGHPWSAEKAWIDDLVRAGTLTRLTSHPSRRTA